MKLADRVAQCRMPFMIRDCATGAVTKLNNCADFADEIGRCPLRFVLSDELTRLCTALAYSKGASTLACADLLHVPAELVWVEWCHFPWLRELEQYGFPVHDPRSDRGGRRGALIRSTPDGRRGTLRTFWTEEGDTSALASSVEAYFDLDTSRDQEPDPPDGQVSPTVRVCDRAQAGDDDLLHRCFRFRFERTWREYHDQSSQSIAEREALMRHGLGTIAIDIPVILVFFLLLATRSGLPQRCESLVRLNRARLRVGRAPLLEHIEVNCPMLPAFGTVDLKDPSGTRRSPRLHHVRGHLFRRGSELFWRVPHLRGSPRSGKVATRTVTWTFDQNVRP
jgi:hypothetical protein